ncbi:MAG: alanine--glyoxylate aminotransferase family protein [Chloroflexota bacterium]|nr:alanine--glyoxylate aminotransferase family protein [Chloroflexota bacterium]
MVNLRIPGPIPVNDDILESMGTPMINHRGPEFKEILYRTTERLKTVFSTRNDVYIITGSGTSAMEAAVVNTLSPGDKAINATVGVFGNRFGVISNRYGIDLVSLEFPFGSDVDLDVLRKCLNANPDVKAVMVTHNETSTGVTNNLQAISAVVKKEYNKLILVDGIISVCSLPLETDLWDLDVVASASQKGWMLPPGLAFISFSEKAWEAHSRSTMPKFYLDMAEYKRYYEIGQPPFTPSVSCMFALDLALDQIITEGMESVFERHASIGQYTRDRIAELNLNIFPYSNEIASNTCTAVEVPEGVDGSKLVSKMRDEHKVVLAGGQASLSGKIFRIGHMGQTTESDIKDVMDALKIVLPEIGFRN